MSKAKKAIFIITIVILPFIAVTWITTAIYTANTNVITVRNLSGQYCSCTIDALNGERITSFDISDEAIETRELPIGFVEHVRIHIQFESGAKTDQIYGSTSRGRMYGRQIELHILPNGIVKGSSFDRD